METQLNHIACGGTFDFFHKGHRHFLQEAFNISKFVSIGLVSDSFCKKLDKQNFQSYLQRKHNIELFLKEKNAFNKYQIIKLDDIYGTARSDKTLEGLLVTRDSLSGAKKINALRVKNGLGPLRVLTTQIVEDQDGKPISSSRIRAGIINREGINYSKYLMAHRFVLPGNLRLELARPFGRVYRSVKSINLRGKIISVGDETTGNFLKLGIVPVVSVVDLRVQRKKQFETICDLGFSGKENLVRAENVPGEISTQLSRAIFSLFDRKVMKDSIVLVDGEEDLAVLPVVLMSEIGTKVYYGLRETGLVEIIVNLKIKDELFNLIRKFKKIT